jgi:hypothetical protein
MQFHVVSPEMDKTAGVRAGRNSSTPSRRAYSGTASIFSGGHPAPLDRRGATGQFDVRQTGLRFVENRAIRLQRIVTGRIIR